MQVSVKYKNWMVSVLDFCFCITSVSISYSGTFDNNFEADPFILAVRVQRCIGEKQFCEARKAFTLQLCLLYFQILLY